MSPSLPGVSQLLRLEETDSTQTVARFLAEQGAPHGTLVWADRQTAGRGRMGRKWSSEPGGLYVSLLLRPKFSHAKLPELSITAAKALVLALTRLSPKLELAIKPPNDVMSVVGGRARKLCGVLPEASGTARRLDWVVLGLGVNVNNRPKAGQPATSLKALTGKSWALEAVLKAFLTKLQPLYRELEGG